MWISREYWILTIYVVYFNSIRTNTGASETPLKDVGIESCEFAGLYGLNKSNDHNTMRKIHAMYRCTSME